MVVQGDKSTLRPSIRYLPEIDSPATAMTTIHKILYNVLQVKNELKMESAVVVFD